MTTTPFMLTVPMSARIASTAAPSPPFLSPRPTQRPAAMAAASVTRTSSMARLRSGASRRRSDAASAPDVVISGLLLHGHHEHRPAAYGDRSILADRAPPRCLSTPD